MTTHEYTAISAREAWLGLVGGLILSAVIGLIGWTLSDEQGPPFSWDDEAVVRAGEAGE